MKFAKELISVTAFDWKVLKFWGRKGDLSSASHTLTSTHGHHCAHEFKFHWKFKVLSYISFHCGCFDGILGSIKLSVNLLWPLDQHKSKIKLGN